jgi:hypothetical protein
MIEVKDLQCYCYIFDFAANSWYFCLSLSNDILKNTIDNSIVDVLKTILPEVNELNCCHKLSIKVLTLPWVFYYQLLKYLEYKHDYYYFVRKQKDICSLFLFVGPDSLQNISSKIPKYKMLVSYSLPGIGGSSKNTRRVRCLWLM